MSKARRFKDGQIVYRAILTQLGSTKNLPAVVPAIVQSAEHDGSTWCYSIEMWLPSMIKKKWLGSDVAEGNLAATPAAALRKAIQVGKGRTGRDLPNLFRLPAPPS